jgi:hypothetical protein
VTGNLPEKPPAQRASDNDREDYVERLREAAAEGRLTMDEFEERMASAYQARTYGELERLTEDLPVKTTAKQNQPTEVRLRATGSTVRRTGRWIVPQRIIVENNMGSAVVDLTEATILSRDVQVDVQLTAGSLTIKVPPGTTADTDDLHTPFGTSSVRVDSPLEPRLRLHVSGNAAMGSVHIRHLNVFERWFRQFRDWRKAQGN